MKKIFTYYLKPYYLRMVLGFSIKFTGTIMDLLLPWALAHYRCSSAGRTERGDSSLGPVYDRLFPGGGCL